eukprot:CAMPEP_0181337732 /NCGR_PEP_ID=MMETSP1101-20121128/28196_1 /TAXON_ID=46948 /ORGANISM="Rhodomonas abbreviata, Strain Caron Lab Isolate" /LENGTH=136 /DNA_ID=CAMNT_0023448287 /DNA_START=27 /DNA_END=437 /DNA_ORIENTATION=+
MIGSAPGGHTTAAAPTRFWQGHDLQRLEHIFCDALPPTLDGDVMPLFDPNLMLVLASHWCHIAVLPRRILAPQKLAAQQFREASAGPFEMLLQSLAFGAVADTLTADHDPLPLLRCFQASHNFQLLFVAEGIQKNK